MRINPNLFELSAEKQELAREMYEHDDNLSQRHCSLVHFNNEYINRPDSYRSIDDPQYQEPTKEQIKEVFDHLASVHSRSIASKMLDTTARSIDRWCAGDSKIPYAAWRLLLQLDGRVVQTSRIPDADGTKAWEKHYKKQPVIKVDFKDLTARIEQALQHAGDPNCEVQVYKDGTLIVNTSHDKEVPQRACLLNMGDVVHKATAKKIVSKKLYNTEVELDGVKYKILPTKK